MATSRRPAPSGTPSLNLDTHILICALRGDLRPRERVLLSRHAWSISAIVLWELANLARLGRISLDLDDSQVRRVLSQVQVWPIDLAVAVASTRLDFQGDSADEIIAATSLVHGIPLPTRDRRIRKSRRVPLA